MTITYLHPMITGDYNHILHDIPIKNLKGIKMAIDTSIIINKYRHIQSTINSVFNKSDLINKGVNEDELAAIIISKIKDRIIKFLNDGILPIFVIDGKSHPLKVQHEGKKREDKNKDNVNQLEQQLAYVRNTDPSTHHLYIDELKDLYKKAYRPTGYFYNKIYEFIQATKLPCYKAKYEADQVLSYLSVNGIVDLVWSNDSDMYAYKCPYIMKDFDKKSRDICIISRTKDLINNLNMTEDEFTDFCILLGCDMNKKLEGVGLVGCKSLINKFRRIDNINTRDISSLNHKECFKVFNCAKDNFDDLCEKYQELNLDNNDFSKLEQLVIEYSIPAFLDNIKAHLDNIKEYKLFDNQKRFGYMDTLKLLENNKSNNSTNITIDTQSISLPENLVSSLNISQNNINNNIQPVTSYCYANNIQPINNNSFNTITIGNTISLPNNITSQLPNISNNNNNTINVDLTAIDFSKLNIRYP